MKNERKIKKLAGKTVKKIIANEYHLIIKFDDGTTLYYRLMTDERNHIEIDDEASNIPNYRKRYLDKLLEERG